MIPFLDSCLQQLNSRFKATPNVLRLHQLLPGHSKEGTLDQVMEVLKGLSFLSHGSGRATSLRLSLAAI